MIRNVLNPRAMELDAKLQSAFAKMLRLSSFKDSDREILNGLLELTHENNTDWQNTWRVHIEIHGLTDAEAAVSRTILAAFISRLESGPRKMDAMDAEMRDENQR